MKEVFLSEPLNVLSNCTFMFVFEVNKINRSREELQSRKETIGKDFK